MSFGGSTAAEHAADLFYPRFGVEFAALGKRAPLLRVFFDPEVAVGPRRHLREVRNAEDLPVAPEIVQLLPHAVRGLAADVHIDLVEDDHRNRVRIGQNRLQCDPFRSVRAQRP